MFESAKWITADSHRFFVPGFAHLTVLVKALMQWKPRTYSHWWRVCAPWENMLPKSCAAQSHYHHGKGRGRERTHRRF